jgi:cytochrome c biogenesis protein CcdA
MEVASLGLGAVFFLGLSFGAGPCNVACLPYLGPVFLAAGEGMKSAWLTILPFSLGRLTGYGLLGAGAGWAGLIIQEWLDSQWAGFVLGSATILVASALLFRSKNKAQCSEHKSSTDQQVIQFTKQTPARSYKPSLFLMGIGMAFNPCTPLTLVIVAAASTASAFLGVCLGLAFGLGAVVLPTLIFAIGGAHFGNEVKKALSHWRTPLEKGSIAMLFLMGTATALGWITP